MNTLLLETRKWLRTVQVSCANQLMYKMNVLLMLVGPTLVFFLVQYNLWSALFLLGGRANIVGYSLPKILQYQACALLVQILALGYQQRNLSQEIRLGRMSRFLIYPFSAWKIYFGQFVASTIFQFVIFVATFFSLKFAGMVPDLTALGLLLGIVSCVFAGVFWFVVGYFFGLLGFWLDETWIFRTIFVWLASFLSGLIVPLEFFPERFRAVLSYTPFPYLTYVPVKILVGQFGDFWFSYFVILLWIVLGVWLCSFVWSKGLKHYSAGGI